MGYQVGQLVKCVKTHEPEYNFLIGAVGEIRELLPFPLSIILGGYSVYFPLHADTPCPKCNKCHGGNYPMHFDEIKPIDDPDKEQDVPRIKALDTPKIGFEIA